MPLSPGEKLGPYEILAALGAGGFGEVYKARDTRLDRTVAIKVLPERIAQRDDLRARFEREARAVASLNHPNICSLFDIGPGYMVMELIDGETLASRIAKGPIPLDQSLKFAIQIADALDRAHRAGVTHRDVKPQNIMLTRDGIKVLDFGLAKSAASKPAPTEETLTVLTAEGTVMGTPQYMAPELFGGKEADARADIWAFGAVLYEMVTGRKAFEGKNYASLVGAILSADPVPVTPRWLDLLVRRCLQKDPDDRYHCMRDLVLDLRTPPVEPAASTKPHRWPRIAAGAMTLIAACLAALHFAEKPELAPETRLDIVTPPTNSPASFALSPDGRKVAYVATTDGVSRLWVRPLDSISAQPLPGTENALNPFWSPDSRSLGFFADGKLKRIDLGGGQPQNLADVGATTTGQGAWSADGNILFTPIGLSALHRIPAAGGQAVAATRLASGEAGHSNPRFLATNKPGDRDFLFRSLGTAPALWVGSLDGGVEPRRVTALGIGESAGEYLAPGWMVRVRGNALNGQRFDPASGRLSGDPVAIAQAVGVDPFSGAGAFSVAAPDSSSRQGHGASIAWRSGTGDRRRLFWFNRAGNNVGAPGAAMEDPGSSFPEISPDGKRVAFTRGTVGSRDLWIREGARTSRFTHDPADDFFTIWSPDGARVVFTSNRKGPLDLYVKAADGSGSEEPLLQSSDTKRPNSWSPDGRFILYWSSRNNGDLMVLPMPDPLTKSGGSQPYPFLSTPFNENQGVFSPDGKWVAYASNESGRYEIYVRPFPGPGGEWQVSTGGGTMPRWRPVGAGGKFELYYHSPDQKLMAVTVSVAGGTLLPGTPEVLFPTHMGPEGIFRQGYDVARDGRFLIVTQMDDGSTEPIHLLLNWHPPGK
jgi:hypothetical protein